MEKLMVHLKKRLSACFLVLISSFYICSPTWAKDELNVLRITTPDNQNSQDSQQILIEFDQPMIALGENEVDPATLPVTLQPAANCQWRWMDSRSLLCQLSAEDKLTPASQYTLNISTALTSNSGNKMSSAVQHAFTTELPDIRSSLFQTWVTAGTFVMQIEFNLPVTKSSIEAHVFFESSDVQTDQTGKAAQKINKRIAIRAIPKPVSKEKDSVLANSANINKPQTIWFITPEKELAPDTRVQLKLEPGIMTDQGPLPSKAARTEIEFYTFPEFEFLGINCYSATENKMILLNESNQDQTSCDPLSTVFLKFSSPVLRNAVKNQVVIKPDLANGRKDYDPWTAGSEHSVRARPHYHGTTYDVWLPERLQAFQPYSIKANNLIDEFGRALTLPIDLSFMTAHRQPNLEINHRHTVLEKQIESQVPAYVTNLTKLDINYQTLTVNGVKKAQEQTVPLPHVTDIAFAHPLPFRDMLEKKSGVITGTIKQIPNPGNVEPYEFFTQVTPYNLQVKLGHFSSLIWVMDLASGQPVANANVSIYSGSYNLKEPVENFTQLKTDQQGLAVLPGLVEMTPDLDLINAWQFSDARLMIRVEKGQDMALLPVSHDFTVWGRGAYPQNQEKFGHVQAWGTTAQGIYRPGDTLQYKLYIRDQNNKTLIPPADLNWDLEIHDPTGKIVLEMKSIELNEFGAFDGEHLLPDSASVGWYRFILQHRIIAPTDDNPENEQVKIHLQPLKVLISDFTPSPFKVSTDLNSALFKPGDSLNITSSARLHAGGPYTQAQTRITTSLAAGYFSSRHAIAKNFQFDTHLAHRYPSTTLLQKQALLDDKGNLHTTLSLTPELDYKNIIYGTLAVESSVQDDRGKSVAKQARAEYIARDRLVGLKNTRWVYEQDQSSEVQYLVVDAKGQPQSGTQVNLSIERSEIKASRVKSAGNAYVTQYITNWIAAGSCSGKSTIEAMSCNFKPEQPGDYRITARIKDSQGREHSSQIGAWVVGKGQVLWEQPSNNNLTIIPESEQIKIGDTARYLVKNPYPGSKALISIERYGILKSWVADFSDSTEVIEFPVDADYMPGFYLSVSVFSPRVEQPLGNNHVDLGKPAFSMGYLKVPVIDPVKQIDVEIKSQQETYKPGEQVELTFSAQTGEKAKQQEPVELAIVVLDEAVFDLIKQGEKYFDPYQGFYSLKSLDVANYNLITRLIGRQNFEKKGANQGGDGGSEINFRSIEKYIGYWNPSLRLSAGKETSISFKAPDNLTSWRVLAMAVTKHDQLGLGSTDFKVNKAIELRPVMPNQILAGDQFQAGFSVVNRTDNERDIHIDISATGNVSDGTAITRSIKLAPFKRKTLWLPIKTTGQAGTIKLAVSAKSGTESDGLSYSIPVLKRDVLDTFSEYGSFTKSSVTTPVQFPQNIRSDTGELSLSLSSTVLDHLQGAFRFMRDYPYACWEQRLSKGVMADHFKQLRDYMPADLIWPENQTITKNLLTDAANFQAPNGGMAFWTAEDTYVSPYLSAYTALAFSWLKESGYKIPESTEKALHAYLDTLLKRDTMPSFYDAGMASTVRAVALAALARERKVSKDMLQRYRNHFSKMSLFGQAHYLSAANSVEGAKEIANQSFEKIMSKSVQSAGKIQFNESKNTRRNQRILATPLRSQCALLSAFMQATKTPEDKLKLGDTPLKMVRAISQTRGHRDHWENTQENLFCMNALSDYSRVYENKPVDIFVQTKLDKQSLGSTEIKEKQAQKTRFVHKIGQTDPGRKAILSIEKNGDARLYYTTQLRYEKLATKTKRIHAGIEIRREYSIQRNGSWELLSDPIKIKRGDLIRVDLFIDLPTARNFVVVDDPVPGGLEPVNRDLATTSTLDANAGNFQAAGGSWWYGHDDWQSAGYSPWSFYHQELRHDSVRFYSDYLSPGHYHLSYTAQAIASGKFTILPAHAEEMYDPDIYGRGLPMSLQVSE